MSIFSARRIARRAALIAGLSVGSGVSALGADANDLINQLKALTTVVQPTPEGKAALAALATAIQKTNCDAALDANQKEICLLLRVKTTFNDAWKAAAADKKSATQDKVINALVDIVVTEKEENAKHDPEGSAIRFAKLLLAELEKVKEKRKEKPEETPKPDPLDEPIKNLVEALTALPKEEEKPTPAVINIASAFYGDFDFIQDLVKKDFVVANGLSMDGKRACNALRAVRSECQGEPYCLQTTAPTGLSLSGPLMCGYEPAPFAEPRHKGLVVNYQCVNFKWNPFGTEAPYDRVWAEKAAADPKVAKKIKDAEDAVANAEAAVAAAPAAIDGALADVESKERVAVEKRQKANSDARALKGSDSKNRAALQKQADESAADARKAENTLRDARANLQRTRQGAENSSKALEQAKDNLRAEQDSAKGVPLSRWAVLRNGQLGHLTCTPPPKEKEEPKTTGSAKEK